MQRIYSDPPIPSTASKQIPAEKLILIKRALNVIIAGCLAGIILEVATFRSTALLGIFATCIVIMAILKRTASWQNIRSITLPLVVINFTILGYVFFRPSEYYISVFSSIVTFALIMLAAQPGTVGLFSALIYLFVVAEIVISSALAFNSENATLVFYRIIATGSASLALIVLLREYHAWITRLQKEAEQTNQELKIARDSLEQQVQDRTRQLEEQNIRLDLSHQEALRLSQVKSDFLATMSHEIRTPMNGILGMSELLLTSGLNEYQLELANVVFESGQGLLVLLNDILDFSRIEAGQFRVDLKPFDLKPCVEDVARLMSARAKENGINVAVKYALADQPASNLQVVGDAARVRQVLFNLVGNAVKFTKNGSVKINVRQEKERVFCEVQDTGPGVPEKFRLSLFQPFMQAEPPNVRQEGGTGLGLAISKRLMALMNGDIGYQPVETGGSLFWFSLPQVK